MGVLPNLRVLMWAVVLGCSALLAPSALAQSVVATCAEHPAGGPLGEDPQWLAMMQADGPQVLPIVLTRDPATAQSAHLSLTFHDPNVTDDVEIAINASPAVAGFGASNNGNFSDRYFSFRQLGVLGQLVQGLNTLTVADTNGGSPLKVSRACIVLVGADPPLSPTPERFCATVGGSAITGLDLDYVNGDEHNAPFLDQVADLVFEVDVPLGVDATLASDFVAFVPGGSGDLTLTLSNTTSTSVATLVFPGAGGNDQRVANSVAGLNASFLVQGTNQVAAGASANGRIWAGCLSVNPGTPAPDAGPPPPDAGPPPPDSGDAGFQATDAALPPPDAGPIPDAGPTSDAGPIPDAGPKLDAGNLPDAFVDPSDEDAGDPGPLPAVDGGDGYTMDDGDPQEANGAIQVQGGCGGCGQSASSAGFFLLALGGLILRPRRHRHLRR
jgi:hypothetical protein